MPQTLQLQPEDKWEYTFKEDSVKAFIVKLAKAGHNTLDKMEEQFKVQKWSPPKASKAYTDSPRQYISGYITSLIANGTLKRIGEKDKPVPPKAKAKAPAKK